MLRAILVLAAAASASAFAPAALPTRAARSSTQGLKMQDRSYAVPFLSRPPALDGTMAGDVGFDPLGFSNYFDLKWLREAELKHGRVCMLGTLGFLVQEKFQLPLPGFGEKLPIEAFFTVPTGGLWQIFFTLGAIEILSNNGRISPGDMFADGRAPGDLGFDPLNLSSDESALRRFELAELKHGRLAMIGLGGMLHQQLLTKQPTLEQLANFQPLQ
ncbi:light-harvesting Chl a protein 2 [Guillardia theta CCMP2712]|uniref:Light-harvesting Chl a protein 2 n=2 Tax=Guillardia theta TaxID=55529 RepID=L1IG04_GUITC|nr:light-harvesting Chl a protein 2 [Guillardia theta CCMP2712]EKX34760.1 light-harvesting Chl a protein 2 [Guillardia theta CCMP2712]CAM33405.1 light harvesting complex protein 2 precursor [Guillardia theta]|eukprot:XP_005821740.1 light-harvesting Chl a protein 2 [Guillardia theta CCMP2712]